MASHILGWPLFALKIAPFAHGDLDPHLIHGSLGLYETTTQLNQFGSLHSSQQSVPARYSGPPIFPLKIAPSHGVIWASSNTWFLGPTLVHTRNCFSIGSPFLQGSLV